MLTSRLIGFTSMTYILVALSAPATAEVLFSDDFEAGATEGEGASLIGWTTNLGDEFIGQAQYTLTPGWSPFGWTATLFEAGNSIPDNQVSISNEGFEVGDFVFKFDVLNIRPERNGALSILLTNSAGDSIFSGQFNARDSTTHYFDTGIYNPDEVDQRFIVPTELFLGPPPYAGLHVKVAVNHSAGTYDLTLGEDVYAGNPLGANVLGDDLVKMEFIAGAGGSNSVNVWLDNVVLSDSVAAENADFNDDGFVDGSDLLIWQRGVGSSGAQGQGDADGNGFVDSLDLDAWKSQFGQPAPASVFAAAVPEPAGFTSILCAICAAAMVGRRMRHL